MRTRRAVALSLFLPLAAGCLTGCGSRSRSTAAASGHPSGDALRGTITVFAAASLTGTFTALGHQFSAAHPGATVRFNFGGSSSLAQQITQGAPADVFAAASPATMAVVVNAGVARGAPATFAANSLEIVVPKANPASIRGLADLARPGVKVALCAKEVPCGAAAATAFTAAGLAVTPVTLEQDVKAVLTKVSLDEVDAGLVYRTDVLAGGPTVRGIDFPEAAKTVTDYPIVALRGAGDAAVADAFIALVRGPAGQAVLAQAGFQAR